MKIHYKIMEDIKSVQIKEKGRTYCECVLFEAVAFGRNISGWCRMNKWPADKNDDHCDDFNGMDVDIVCD